MAFTADGTIAGAFGGVPVAGTWSGTPFDGVFTLTVDGKAFAMGTYECMRGECCIIGEELLGEPRSFLLSFAPSVTGTHRGVLRGLYRTHDEWVRSVAQWAQAHLEPPRAGQITAEAAGRRG